jgi:hypothetical protein
MKRLAMIGGAAWIASLAIPTPVARAQVACDALTNPVYVQSGDTQEPLLKNLGRQLRDSERDVTVVYVTAGSCDNIAAFYDQTPITVNMRYVPSSLEDPKWTPSMPSLDCTVPVDGVPIDVAISALFVNSCDASEPPPGVQKITGPVQAYVLATPRESSQVAITAEEAYFVFGFGNAGMVTPWNDEAFMFIRPITKSTLLTWAANILVPAGRWFGQEFDASGEVVNALVTASDKEKAIGILGAEIYDRNRDTLKTLAFRAFGQRFAYFPDKTSTSSDKQNVRDGHYTVWSPTEYLIRVDKDGLPVNADAGLLVDLILGKDVEGGIDFNPLDSVVGVGLVPDCAMQVSRPADGGDLSLYTPEEPCGCYFDSVVAETTCATCETADECGDGMICKYGYCEQGGEQ